MLCNRCFKRPAKKIVNSLIEFNDLKSIIFLLLINPFIFFTGCKEQQSEKYSSLVIGEGQMPAIINDGSTDVHIVYGNGDSILYAVSDNHGTSFSIPALVAILPNLAASHTRGPQIAITENGITIIACNEAGNIFSYTKDKSGKWQQGSRVNDVDTVAKEGLMALSGDKESLFAVWLDLRDGHNKIVGAKSTNGGKNWSKNIVIYTSPDTTVCECCKPSVAVKGNNVYVMFRNWLNGNRDMYLIESTDAGNSFGEAKKLGGGSWALNGCPMDGGGLAINKKDVLQTVWRRKTKLYACEPGKEEIEIGEGRSCTMESVNGKNVYAWTEKGEIFIRKPQGMKRNLGKGQLPLIKAINNEHIICVWENEKQIHTAVVEL